MLSTKGAQFLPSSPQKVLLCQSRVSQATRKGFWPSDKREPFLLETASTMLNDINQTSITTMLATPNKLSGSHIDRTACSQACSLGKMGFIDSLRGGNGPSSHDSILDFPITASTHSFLSIDDLLNRFGTRLDISNNGMSLLSAEDIIGDEVTDDEAA